MITNKLNWISSPAASPELLRQLDVQMTEFYASMDDRPDYQKMNDDLHDVEDHPNNKLAGQMASHVVSRRFENVLEIGCGSGKIYRHLLKEGFKGRYTGIEMAEYVIKANIEKYPEAQWEVGSAYNLKRYSNCFDCCFSFYVLEHLIYPDKGLASMLDTVKPGGALVLLFPDFRSTGILPSQKIGLRYGTGAKDKLKKGKVLDAVVSLLEAKIMRNALRQVNRRFGDFVINYKPYCLDNDCDIMLPDFDAIYLANKEEVENWARKQGHEVFYPLGKENLLATNAFLAIVK